jgi:hypothetical protein
MTFNLFDLRHKNDLFFDAGHRHEDGLGNSLDDRDRFFDLDNLDCFMDDRDLHDPIHDFDDFFSLFHHMVDMLFDFLNDEFLNGDFSDDLNRHAPFDDFLDHESVLDDPIDFFDFVSDGFNFDWDLSDDGYLHDDFFNGIVTLFHRNVYLLRHYLLALNPNLFYLHNLHFNLDDLLNNDRHFLNDFLGDNFMGYFLFDYFTNFWDFDKVVDDLLDLNMLDICDNLFHYLLNFNKFGCFLEFRDNSVEGAINLIGNLADGFDWDDLFNDEIDGVVNIDRDLNLFIDFDKFCFGHEFFHFAINWDDLGALHTFFNHLLDDLFNFDYLGNNSENFEDIVDLDQTHDLSLDHCDDFFVHLQHDPRLDLDLFQLFEKCFDEDSQMELDLPCFL